MFRLGGFFSAVIGVISAISLSSVVGCKNRQFNTSKSNSDDTNDVNFFDRFGFGKFVDGLKAEMSKEAAHGSEAFTTDIDCNAIDYRKLVFQKNESFPHEILKNGKNALSTEAKNNAVIMARASFLSYKKTEFLLTFDASGKASPSEEVASWGFTKGELLSDPTSDAQAFVFSNLTTVLVVFRGTSSPMDVIVDLDLVKVEKTSWGLTHRGFSIAYRGGRTEGLKELVKGDKPVEGIQSQLFEALLRHGYDVNLWSNLSSKRMPSLGNATPVPQTDKWGFHKNVDATVPQSPQKELWITGHSAGGALAQLLAADLTEREVELKGLWGAKRCESLKAPTNYVTGVVSFGSPRLGDKEFAQCMDTALKGRNWRFVNNNDIVTQIPWVEFGYRHAGEHLLLTDTGGLIVKPRATEVFSDLLKGIVSEALRGRVDRALAKGVHDHFVYPQPLQHQYNTLCPYDLPLAENSGAQPANP